MLGVQGMKESARMELSSVAEEHWSDGALDVRIPFALTRIWSNPKTCFYCLPHMFAFSSLKLTYTVSLIEYYLLDLGGYFL
jgi:hypothetical protein